MIKCYQNKKKSPEITAQQFYLLSLKKEVVRMHRDVREIVIIW